MELKLDWIWVPSREDRETVLVCFFDESLCQNSISENDCLSVNHWMLFVEKLKILSLSNIQKSSNILFGFWIVCVNYSSFVSVFNENMRLRSTPKRIPQNLKRNMLHKVLASLSQEISYFSEWLFLRGIIKPLNCFWIRSEVSWKFDPKPSSVDRFLKAFMKNIRRLKELFPSNAYFLTNTIHSK